jgi:hypothetical protein
MGAPLLLWRHNGEPERIANVREPRRLPMVLGARFGF